MSIVHNGVRRYKPGVYSSTEVVSSLSGPLPAFHVPVVIGWGFDGHGYDARAKSVANEIQFDWYRLCTSPEEVGNYFGVGSDIHVAAQFAFRHGLPRAYFCALSPMVRASVIVDASTTAQFTLHARRFGPIGGWLKLSYASNTLTLQRVLRYALISATVTTTGTRVYLQGGGIHSWLTPGASVVVGANNAAGAARTIVDSGIEVQANGQIAQWVELSSAHGTELTVANYGVILQYEPATVVKTGLTTGQAIIDYVNGTTGIPASPDLVAVKHANFTNAAPDDVSALTPIKEISAWSTTTPGTAPSTIDGDMTAWVTLMDGGARSRFEQETNSIARMFLLADSDDTRHGTMRDYAIVRRTNGAPIGVMTGCAWGDVVVAAGNTTAPEFRSAALNSEDVMLAACGLDRRAACLSLAAAYFGRRVSGGIGHNLTNDEMLFSHLETNWTDTQLDTLLQRGVATVALTYGDPIRYKLAQGISTLQANSVIINQDGTTWSVMTRDAMDFNENAMSVVLNEQVIGADAVTPVSIAAVARRRAEQLVAAGSILAGSFGISSITLNAGGNGYDVVYNSRVPTPTDFLHVTQRVFVGGDE